MKIFQKSISYFNTVYFRLHLFITGTSIFFFFLFVRPHLHGVVIEEALLPTTYYGSLFPAFFIFILMLCNRSDLQRFILFFLFFSLFTVFILPLRSHFLITALVVAWISLTASMLFRLLLLNTISIFLISGFVLNSSITISAWKHQLLSYDTVSIASLFLLQILTMQIGWTLRKEKHSQETLNDEIRSLSLSVEQLYKANLGFQQYAANARNESILEERKRISREIHDSVGHQLVNVIMMLQEANDYIPEESRLHNLLQETRSEAQGALISTRKAMRIVREVIAPKSSLSSCLHNLSTMFHKATGIEAMLDIGNLGKYKIEPGQHEAIYSIVQEAFTNSIRHGRASRVDVYFWVISETLNIYISDNGRGTSFFKKGIGLQGMEERITNLNGNVTFNSSIGKGFKTIVRIPL
jgi:signal transduction histidine kinase